MDDLPVPGPLADSPTVAFPLALLQRLVSVHASAAEQQIVLVVAQLSRQTKGSDIPVSQDALIRSDLVAIAGHLEGTPVQDDGWIWQALEQAIMHGLLVRFAATHDEAVRTWFLLNTVENVRAVSAMIEGTVPVPTALWISDVAPRIAVDRPTVFRLYEQNIGPLTPLLADRLIRATETYPIEWVESAIGEAVTYNRRNWRYIERILENWKADGLPSSAG